MPSKSQGISSVASPRSGLAAEEIACDFEGTGLQLGVNPDYFTQFLKETETEQVRLELKDENSQCVAYPVDGQDKRYVCVIMPIRL